jgi:hypothetical protein
MRAAGLSARKQLRKYFSAIHCTQNETPSVLGCNTETLRRDQYQRHTGN